jgi:hypothetical protein
MRRSSKLEILTPIRPVGRQENELVSARPCTVELPGADRQFRYRAPSLIGHQIQALRDRIRLKIDQKTTLAVTAALRIQGEQLKLANEFQASLNTQQIADVEREVRLDELEQKREEIAIQRQQNQALFELRLRRDRLALQAEMVRFHKEIQDARRRPEPKPNPTQQRLKKKAEIEADIQRLRDDEAVALGNGNSELEKRRIQNMYSDRRDRLMEQLEKYL